VFETLREQFSDEEIAKLTLLVGTINLWNRMAISFRAVHPTNLVKARASS
jgi:alkylhydroperoxidase family enzyme